MKKQLLLLIFIAGIVISCTKTAANANNIINPTPIVTPLDTLKEFYKGADIGWLTEMEAAGLKFYTAAGTQQEGMALLKSLGMNSIRLRVWVNPADGWCNTADVVNKALRAKALGMKIMIDFHYSDSWADPGKQTKPAAWVGQDFTTLKQSVSTHTFTVLNTLKTNGIIPAWVQVGNETNDGMLWPDGRASANMNNFAQLVNAGYDAVKSIDTSIKVIVHISNGYDNGLFRWMFDGLKKNGAKWDIIGMSLYPNSSDWTTLNSQCLTNMNDMAARYNTDVMVVEIGMSFTEATATNSFITDLITKVKSVNNNRGRGVFYWEPECFNHWKAYTLGAFDNTGKPTTALDAFK